MRAFLFLIVMAFAVCGCESAHVGMGIPIPGPVKPSVGVTVDRSGVKGTGGVGANAGPVPVYVGGTTKPVSVSADKNKGK